MSARETAVWIFSTLAPDVGGRGSAVRTLSDRSGMICGMLGDEEREIQQETSRHFPAWDTAELPAPPPFGLRNWKALIGPGLVLAGSNIGEANGFSALS